MIVIGNIADKIKKLKTEYKKTKDRDKGTGTGRIVHKFFKELDEVLGPRPATQPAVLYESSAAIPPCELLCELSCKL